MSNYYDMLTQLNDAIRPAILGVDVDKTTSNSMKITPLSELVTEEDLKETYEKGTRLWSYAVENNKTLYGIQSVCFYTKKKLYKN